MIGIKLILLPYILLLFKFINCDNFPSPDCSNEVYSELGLTKSDNFCGTVDAKVKIISNNETSKIKYELQISQFSSFWVAVKVENVEQILMNGNTPTFIRDVNRPNDESITHCRTQEGIQPMGNFVLLQNWEKKTAVVLFDNGIVEGKVNKLHLRYVPSIRQYVLIVENKYLDDMQHLISQHQEVNNSAFDLNKINRDRPMYYKVLVPLDFSFVKGKTYSEVLRTILIFWNEVDMHFRLLFSNLKISLNIVGVIMPHESFWYLTKTADNLYSTIDPNTVGNFFRWNRPVYNKFLNTIFTMTALPLCDRLSDDNRCQKSTSGITKSYKNSTDFCDPLSMSLSRWRVSYGAVIQYQKGISHAEDVAKNLKEAFEANDEECKRENWQFVSEKYSALGDFPQTLTSAYMEVYTAVKICSAPMDINKSMLN